MSKWSKPGTNLRAIPLHISYIYPNEHKTITIMDIKTGHRIHVVQAAEHGGSRKITPKMKYKFQCLLVTVPNSMFHLSNHFIQFRRHKLSQ